MRRPFPILAALALAGVFCAGAALAALDEKPVIDDINDTIAVINGLTKQLLDIEANLEVVRASFELTNRQYEAQKKLYENEVAHGDKTRAEMFKARLVHLERQMKVLKGVDLEKEYAKRVESLLKQIKERQAEIEARVIEFQTLFGKQPPVDMSYVEELKKRQGTRVDAAYYLRLD